MVVLREQLEPHRLLPIFIGVPEAAAIATTVSGETAERPSTHDLVTTLLGELDAAVDCAMVTELRDGAFIAQLTVRCGDSEHLLDSRPSDAIALAARAGAPVLVSEEVLDEAGVEDPTAEIEAEIEVTVDEFRSFLDNIDPADFMPAVSGELGPAVDPDPDSADDPDNAANDPDDQATGDDGP